MAKGDDTDIRLLFENTNQTFIKNLIGDHDTIIIDEAQRIDNIGLFLKIFHDNFPNVQLIATGSSSFDLTNVIKEPLTGWKREILLYPISTLELIAESNLLEEQRQLNQRLI